MRGNTNPTNCAGVLRRSRTTGTRKGWLWESRVFGGFGSRHEGVWSFVDVWDQGEHPNVVFTREGSFWCIRIIGTAASSGSSSSEQQLGVGRRSRQSLLRSRLPTTPTLVLRNSWPGPSPLIGAATQLYTFAGVSAPSGSPARSAQLP